MVSITSVDFFITTHFIISIACPMWASAKLFRFDLDNSFEFRAKYRFDADKLWRTSGLFIRRSQIRRLQKDRVLDDLFVIETSRVMFPFNGTCDMPVEIERGEAMPECDDESRAPAPLNGSNWAGTTRGCCNTWVDHELKITWKWNWQTLPFMVKATNNEEKRLIFYTWRTEMSKQLCASRWRRSL